jgi:predicted DNA-binding transcriptional regulator AlpA
MTSPRHQAEQNSALEAIRELQASHFNEDPEAADENNKFSISFRVTFDRTTVPTKITISSRIAKALAEVVEASAQRAVAPGVEAHREQSQQASRWLTEKEMAEHLQLSTRHLINLRKAGLPYIQLGSSVRYDLAEVEAYVRGNRRLSSHVERKRRTADLHARIGSQSGPLH